MKAKTRKFHYVYKITRIDTGKYYIGMHSTDDLDDEYFGSGRLIIASIKKHGKEKHIKEILEFCESRELLKLREKELIGSFYLEDASCMNLCAGGSGGFLDEIHAAKFHSSGGKATGAVNLKQVVGQRWHNKRGEMLNICSAGGKIGGLISGPVNVKSMNSPQANEKRKSTFAETRHQQGEKNSQFGKKWIYHRLTNESMRVMKDEPIPEGWCKGRKIKFDKNVI